MQTDAVKNVADAVIIGGSVVGTLTDLLPSIAAALGIVYTIVRLIIEWPNLKAAVKRWFK